MVVMVGRQEEREELISRGTSGGHLVKLFLIYPATHWAAWLLLRD